MSQIERFASNTPWEPIFGYSRAVRAGEWLAISGTTATDERGMLVGVGQMYVQARQALLNLKHHIERAGLRIGNVVRTRVFVTDISRFDEVARAHKEIMGEAAPAATLVEVRRLVHPDMLVEIEADVYAGGGAQRAQSEPTAQQPATKPGSQPARKSRPVPRKAAPKRKKR
jgi:enamine deaminase RidA (YjgF/YER057c/UK114 family)